MNFKYFFRSKLKSSSFYIFFYISVNTSERQFDEKVIELLITKSKKLRVFILNFSHKMASFESLNSITLFKFLLKFLKKIVCYSKIYTLFHPIEYQERVICHFLLKFSIKLKNFDLLIVQWISLSLILILELIRIRILLLSKMEYNSLIFYWNKTKNKW